MANRKQQALGYLATVELNAVLAALNAHNGNRTHTAAFLGISIRGLHFKLTHYASLGYSVPEAPQPTPPQRRKPGK
jgi:DNA-binding NtrC family response regulator